MTLDKSLRSLTSLDEVNGPGNTRLEYIFLRSVDNSQLGMS